MDKNIWQGTYLPVDDKERARRRAALAALQSYQDAAGIQDTEVLYHRLRKTQVTDVLGYVLFNNDKHGLDAQKQVGNQTRYLSVHNVTLSDNMAMTCNDMSPEKCAEFAKPDIHLAVGIWVSAGDLFAIVTGHHPGVAREMLRQTERHSKAFRNVVKVSVVDLIRTYGFTVYAHARAPRTVAVTLQECLAYPAVRVLSLDEAAA